MKILSTTVILFLWLALIMGVVLLSNKNNTQAPSQDVDDSLSSESIVREVNTMREALGLSQLEINSALVEQASDDSYVAAKIEKASVSTDEIISSFTTLSGPEGRQYYSASGLIAVWMQDAAKRAVLTRQGTTIGAWGTFSMVNEKAKPVPWVAVIIR